MDRRAVLALGGGAALAPALALAAARPVRAQAAPVSAEDMTLGRPDAPLTLVEYASVTCPACANWHLSVLPALKTRWIDPGHLRYVYREFLTAPPALSAAGAMLARCAGPERYFEVIDVLMRGQPRLQQPGGDSAWLRAGALAGAMDEAALRACLGEAEAVASLNQRIEAARAAGVNSTPTFFLNGARFSGYVLADFEAELGRRLPALRPAAG